MKSKKKPPSRRRMPAGRKTSKRFCTIPEVRPRELPAGIAPNRARLIRRSEKKWVNGTVLHYALFDDPNADGPDGRWAGAPEQQDAVRQAFQDWKDLGLGLEFREVGEREEAEIRIGFDPTDGSWSYIGRDAIDHARDPDERTMNFGWDLTDSYGHDTALHEIGHALGFPHEHQNPNAGIQWNEDAVYAYFGGDPNYWDRDTIRRNILNKLDPRSVDGSDWDPDSIMHYDFPPGLILRPPPFYETGLTPDPGLSPIDVREARDFYPGVDVEAIPDLVPFEARTLDIEPGQQLDFRIRPAYTRRYRIQTFGTSDTVLVLFDDNDDEPRYLRGDDDSGEDRNAWIEERLYRGRQYLLRARLYFSDIAGSTAVMLY